MKHNSLIVMTSITVLLGASSASLAQVVGSTQLGIAAAKLRDVTTGWSATRQILGHTV
jgi:hypothetical protein